MFLYKILNKQFCFSLILIINSDNEILFLHISIRLLKLESNLMNIQCSVYWCLMFLTASFFVFLFWLLMINISTQALYLVCN